MSSPSSVSEEIVRIIEQVRQHPRLVIADDFEIIVQRCRGGTRKFTNGELTHTSQAENLWVSLRILHRKQPGRAVTSARSREALALLVDNAFDSAKLSSPDPWFRFPIWKPVKEVAPQALAKRTEREEPQSIVYDSLHPNLGGGWDLFEESYETSQLETVLRRKSERFGLSHARQIHGLSFSLLSRGQDGLTWLKEERAFGRPLHERVDWLSSLARSSVRLRKAGVTRLPGKARVLLGPAAAVGLLRKMVPGFYADTVQAGRNLLPVEVGRALFAPCITVIDHGNLPEAPHSAPFDMEGSLTQETVLVDRGSLKNLLYDTYAATRENRLSTGNFLKTTQATHPGIAASNIFIKPGLVSVGQLLLSMGKGIVIESVDALEPVSGEENTYSMRGRGWRVAEGRCVEAIRDIGVKFEIFKLFQTAAAVGNDLRFFGAHGCPSILFEEIPLST